VEKVVISVGKIYYDLVNVRAEKGIENTAIIRLEEIYPFPTKVLSEILADYPKVKEIVFCQDEPANKGYAVFVREYLEDIVDKSYVLRIATRPKAAVPVVGYNSYHNELYNAHIEDVFA